ncbi:MAG TPA: putative Na+/H+ antiporter [Chlamydiales bacterium]|jgi:hypothetical protein|nr:putative Na+/H+ antiporter [Chlamydiales bacterium]
MPFEIIKAPGKFDCLKDSNVLALENLEHSSFHIIALLLLCGAVLHTLFVHKVHALARIIEAKQAPKRAKERSPRSIGVQVLYFLSEVEIVFAIWAVPLFFIIAANFGWEPALEYINTRDYTEALFVVIILSLASTRPIIQISQTVIQFLAKGLGGTLSAWWFVLLTVGPLLGSFITEPGAMAIVALLLSKKFYQFRPSSKLAYATLALLFTNISVGGVLTNFASPAILILSHAWEWSSWDMFTNFGAKAILGIFLANGIHWFYFRKEFALLNERKKLADEVFTPPKEEERPTPRWITGVHLFTIAAVVLSANYPAIFMATYLFFVGFHQTTRRHQEPLRLARPLLVGLFIAGLVIHGGVQAWWVVEALVGLDPIQVLGMSMGLTAFNDNTAIAYLATLIPYWSKACQYALITGVISGGGLTVIANAPNPAGFVILSEHFNGSASSWKLFLNALIPALIFYLVFSLFSPVFREVS